MSVQPMTLMRLPVMPMATNMRHVVQLVLPLTQFVATLSQQLSWSDFVNLQQMHKDGITAAEYWTDLRRKAVLCADTKTRNLCARTPAQRKLPVEIRIGTPATSTPSATRSRC